jgi:hypothetical protein
MAQRERAITGRHDLLDVDDVALWERTVEALTARGATPAEAIDGANLIVQAARRKRAERAPKSMRSSGVRTREK